MEQLNNKETTLLIIAIIIIFIGGVILGYVAGTYKIQRCKTMGVNEAFEDKHCREFFLGD